MQTVLLCSVLNGQSTGSFIQGLLKDISVFGPAYIDIAILKKLHQSS